MAPLIDADLFRRYCPRCAEGHGVGSGECSLFSPQCWDLVRVCILERVNSPGEPVLGVRVSGSYPVSEGYY